MPLLLCHGGLLLKIDINLYNAGNITADNLLKNSSLGKNSILGKNSSLGQMGKIVAWGWILYYGQYMIFMNCSMRPTPVNDNRQSHAVLCI